MHCAIFIAALHLLSSPVINAVKGNGDDNWIDPFSIDSKADTDANYWTDPLDLEDHRNLQKTPIKSSTENEVKELSEESKNEKVVGNVETTEKMKQINGKVEVSTKILEETEGGSAETESKVKFGEIIEKLEKEVIRCCAMKEMEHNFLQRFINLLVNICISKGNEKQKKISVMLEISPEELNQLQRLKDNEDISPAIRVLNTIISEMKFNDHKEDHSSFFCWVIQLISSKEVWMEIGVISFAILPSCLFILGGRITRILCITLLMTFSVSYYGTYRYLLLKVKEKNERILSGTLTCTPDERSWYHSVFGSNSDSECQKKWNALHVDPTVEVTPVSVISHMIGVIIFQPLEQFGVMFSSFSSQIFDSQPMLRGMIVYTTAVLIIIIVIFFCCYGIHDRGRGFGSHNYPYTYAGHRHCNSEPAASSLHPKSRNQIFNPRARNDVSGLYEALPQQPVYIITNYSDRNPKNAVTKNVKQKPQLPAKGESFSSKRKTGKSNKRNTKNSCKINDETEINNAPADKTETTDDES